jgi:hypothetical protein
LGDVTTLERNVHQALSAAEGIRWFRGYLQGILDSGEVPPEMLETALRAVYERFRAEGREDLADLALDGLDLLTGWHGPGMGIAERTPA